MKNNTNKRGRKPTPGANSTPKNTTPPKASNQKPPLEANTKKRGRDTPEMEEEGRPHRRSRSNSYTSVYNENLQELPPPSVTPTPTSNGNSDDEIDDNEKPKEDEEHTITLPKQFFSTANNQAIPTPPISVIGNIHGTPQQSNNPAGKQIIGATSTPNAIPTTPNPSGNKTQDKQPPNATNNMAPLHAPSSTETNESSSGDKHTQTATSNQERPEPTTTNEATSETIQTLPAIAPKPIFTPSKPREKRARDTPNDEHPEEDNPPLDSTIIQLENEVEGDSEFQAFSSALIAPTIRITQKHLSATETKNSLTKSEWKKLLHEDIKDVGLKHYSANPTDFMSESMIRVRESYAKDPANTKDSDLANIVAKNIPRILVKVLHNKCGEKEQTEWIRHAIRSILVQAGQTMGGLIATVMTNKPGYDWHVVTLSKEAHEQLKPIRAIFDPRSGTTVLLRKWEMNPPRHQSEITLAPVLLKNQINGALAATPVLQTLEVTDCVYDHGSGQTFVTFSSKSDNDIPPKILPAIIPKRFIGPDDRQRNLKASWLKKCNVCGSEVHPTEPKCPWLSLDFEGKTPNLESPRKLRPGQSNLRKRQTMEENLPQIFDARPKKRIRKDTTHNQMDIS
ncbi:hypothetical protein FRC17_008893 [Serendipita sp. 399]|nr:hypothetical protein FRC17_008893 [Serendipita sp. 399]